jgi:transposase-like protein
MESMARPNKCPKDFRKRAVRVVFEWRDARGVTSSGVKDIAEQLGVNPETLRNWLKRGDRHPRIRSASPSWSGRTVSCDGPARSSCLAAGRMGRGQRARRHKEVAK